MNPLSSWLHDHDGLLTLSLLLVWLALVFASARPLRDSFGAMDRRVRIALLVAAVLAFLISTLWMPGLSRFEALGHEASYMECFTTRPMDGSSTVVSPANTHGWEPYVTYPLIRWTYWLVGGLVGRPDSPAALLLLNSAFRAASVLLLAWAAFVLSGRGAAAVAAGLLMAAHPWHAFWGAALYNVAMPYFFVSSTLLMALLAWRLGSGRLLAAAAASGCLVVAGRVEWGVLAPCLAVLLLGLGPSWGRAGGILHPRFWAPGIVLAVVVGAALFLSGGQLTEQGGYHDMLGYLQTLGRQAWIVDLLEPFHTPWAWALVGGGAFAMVRAGRGGARAVLGLLGFFVLGHLALSTFNDYSFRHGMVPMLGLVLLSAMLGPAVLHADRRIAAIAALLLLAQVGTSLAGVQRIASRYYLSQDEFFEQHPGFQGPELTAPSVESGACFVITDNERHWQMGIAGSHFNLMDPGEAVTHWRRFDGCILWLFDNAGYRYDGLAVPPRTAKLRSWFDWEYQGWTRLQEGEVLVYRMTTPPWGITDDMPVPETEFRLPGDVEPEEEPEGQGTNHGEVGGEGAGGLDPDPGGLPEAGPIPSESSQ